MRIIKPPVLKCKKCFTLNSPDIDDFGDPDIEQHERSMGYECLSVWQFRGNCIKCDNELQVDISGWEYPIGIFNYAEFSPSGCNFSEEPKLEASLDDETLNDLEDEE